MEKWLIRSEQVGNIVRLPEGAKILSYSNDEDNGQWLDYMVKFTDEELEARLPDTERELRHQCLSLLEQAKSENLDIAVSSMLNTLDHSDAFFMDYSKSDYKLTFDMLQASIFAGRKIELSGVD